MKKFVLVSVDFKKDLGQSRRKQFAKHLKKNGWNREIPSISAWWKRIDENSVEKAKTDVRRSCKEAEIKQWNAICQVSPKKPSTF